MTYLVDFGLLLLSIFCASSGITWFALMTNMNPVLKACWRMQFTVLIQLPMMIYELRQMDRTKLGRWRASLLRVILPTGAVLGIHFWTVSVCVSQTSLTHAILLVNAPPLFLVSWSTCVWLVSRALVGPGPPHTSHGTLEPVVDETAQPRRQNFLQRMLDPSKCLPPTSMEALGALVAFAGVAGLVSSTATASAGGAAVVEAQATLQGDLIGLIASASLGFYFAVGGSVRKWCPLFSWLCPLHASAAVTTAVIGLLAFPGTTLVTMEGKPDVAVLGWMTGGPNALYALAAACIPGMLGHGIANFVIGRVGGLTVSVFQLLQPASGTTIGYLAGVQGPPGLASLLCAPVILYGAFLVTVGAREKGFTWRQVLRCDIHLMPAPSQAAPEKTLVDAGSMSGSAKLSSHDSLATSSPCNEDPYVITPCVDDWSATIPSHVPRMVHPSGVKGNEQGIS